MSRSRTLLVALLAIAVALPSAVFLARLQNTNTDFEPSAAFGYADGSSLDDAYTRWLQQHEERGGDSNVTLSLGWSKAYSSELSLAKGRAKIDLIGGSVAVEVQGLEDEEIRDVWLVDNQPGEGRSARPEAGDVMLHAGSLSFNEDGATLYAELGEMLSEFEVDQVVLARAGQDPVDAGVLYGSPKLFQRVYTRTRLGRSVVPMEAKSGPLGIFSPTAAMAAGEVFPTFDPLIIKGADLFFNETFKGNGRTCGTCHPADNNLTIDPESIAKLPKKDPLFVAEFVPALANNFEKPKLMRSLGLILENTNGFGDLENDFTMRGVPHTLALPTSLTPAPNGADGSTIPPDERTGWSGDGSPGSGTLREFSNGAITQHFPKTLGRVPGVDFRLATDAELDAMEAFMLFTGRDADPADITAINFRSAVVARGRDIFVTNDAQGGTVAAGKCNLCHGNAGANVTFIPGGFNFNFNTGVEDLADQPADILDAANNPPDDGFGSPGNGTFNTPPLIEAADTGPFFHNNSIETIEEAVNFYNSAAFNNSPSGQAVADPVTGIGIDLEATQVVAVAAFLRVMNVLENIRSAAEFASFTTQVNDIKSIQALARLAAADAQDGFEVLDCGGLHPAAQAFLSRAASLLRKAGGTNDLISVSGLIDKAIKNLKQANSELVGPTISPAPLLTEATG